jgi:hypothetical protein
VPNEIGERIFHLLAKALTVLSRRNDQQKAVNALGYKDPRRFRLGHNA